MLDIIVGLSTDPGKLRARNEDAMGSSIPTSPQETRTRGWMFVVADGAGGLDCGDVAAAQTVAILESGFAAHPLLGSLPGLLQRLIQSANDRVHSENMQPRRIGKRMATTVVACALNCDQAVIAHVGDSRCYHIRDGKLLAVTQDHTWANEQQILGLITPAQAAASESRRILTRSVGLEPFITVDTITLEIKAGDALLLCTDGVYGGLYDHDLVRIISETKDPQKAADELVRYAVEVDGSDNASAVVIQVLEVERSAPLRKECIALQGGFAKLAAGSE